MVWFVRLEGRPKRFSNYKDLQTAEVSPWFKLQRRKTRKGGTNVQEGHRQPFRIVTKGDPFFEVAYGSDLALLEKNEWAYVTKELPKSMPHQIRTASPQVQERWLVAQCATWAATQQDPNTMPTSQNNKDVSDSEEEGAGEHHPHHHRGISLYLRSLESRDSRREKPSGGVQDVGVNVPLNGRDVYIPAALLVNCVLFLIHDASAFTFYFVLLALNFTLMFMILPSPSKRKTLLFLRFEPTARPKVAATAVARSPRRSPDRRGSGSSGGSPRGASRDLLGDGLLSDDAVCARIESPILARNKTVDDDRFSECAGEKFNVRTGPNYKKNRQKELSDSGMSTFLGMDIFRTKSKTLYLAQHLVLPQPPPEDKTDDPSDAPFFIVLNIMIPDYEPSMLGGKDDGEGYSIVLYWALTANTRRKLRECDPKIGCFGLLHRFIEACRMPEEDDVHKLRGRLKAIPTLLKTEMLSGVVKGLVAKYNSTPFMTGPTKHTLSAGRDFVECDIDVHRYTFLARKALYGLLEVAKDIEVDFGLVIQAEEDEEQPERMLACATILGCDLSLAPLLTDRYPEFLTDEHKD